MTLPIPATSALNTSINGRTNPADDAAKFLKKVNAGEQEEAMQLFAQLMGVDDPDKIPPVSTTDSSSYESALVLQIGAQMHFREFAFTTVPRLLGSIKLQG